MRTDETARLLPGLRALRWSIESRTLALLVFWLSIAVPLTLSNHFASLGEPFDYIHTQNSSHYSLEARSFAKHGVIALGGVPIRNNPPLGLKPDIYTHWPPLFPIILSVVFRLFGESETVAHGLMLAILVANSITMYALVNICCGKRAALFAVFASLTMPATLIYSYMVMPYQLAMLCTLLALLGFIKATITTRLHRGWTAFGLASLVAAVFTSWEPLLICPGLLAVAMWQRHPSQIRLALLYASVGTMVFIGILIIYALHAPSFVSDLWYTVRVRIGFAPPKSTHFHMETMLRDRVYSKYALFSLPKHLVHFVEQLSLIGPLAVATLGGILITGWTRRHSDSDGRVALLFGGLLSPWLLWFIMMRNHAHIHDFMILMAVPAASAALGFGVMGSLSSANGPILSCGRGWRSWLIPVAVGTILLGMLGSEFIIAHYLRPKPKGLLATLDMSSVRNLQAVLLLSGMALLLLRRRIAAIKGVTTDDMRWRVLVILPIVMLVPMMIGIENRLKDPEWANSRIAYARDIYASTDPKAIVLSSDRPLSVTYYSKRHVILGIVNDSLVNKSMEQVPAMFPGSSVYLALRPEDLKEFSQSLQQYQIVKQTPHLILLSLLTANTDTNGSQIIMQ